MLNRCGSFLDMLYYERPGKVSGVYLGHICFFKRWYDVTKLHNFRVIYSACPLLYDLMQHSYHISIDIVLVMSSLTVWFFF